MLNEYTEEREIIMREKIQFILNGKAVEATVPPLKTLLKVLREDLRHTEVKAGCEQGECGSCTVIIDGEIVNSCVFPVCQVKGKNVTTIAGIGSEKNLHPIQKAFIEEGAVQCGFCTPGLVLSVKVLLDKNPSPSEEDIKEAISGNLCRCTGYIKIIEAAKKAAKEMKEKK